MGLLQLKTKREYICGLGALFPELGVSEHQLLLVLLMSRWLWAISLGHKAQRRVKQSPGSLSLVSIRGNQ